MMTMAQNPAVGHSRVARRRRLLLIAYTFPPVGGAGVQRPVKWVKYLQHFGWDVTVLTPSNPSVPVRDESLLENIPAQTRIVRTPTWEPGYRFKQGLVNGKTTSGASSPWASYLKQFVRRSAEFLLQPDPQVLWVPNAVEAGLQALQSEQHDAIVVTMPPYSAAFAGCELKARCDLPLILDFRDEWDLSAKYLEHGRRDWFSMSIQRRMQDSILRQADGIVATTTRSVQSLQRHLDRIDAHPETACIYNGYDQDDFQKCSESLSDQVPRPADGAFRLVYTGTLWNLTDISPVVQAIERLNDQGFPELGRLELVCVGRKTPEQLAALERLKRTACQLRMVDYCDHAQVATWLDSSHATLLLLADGPGADRVVPAKLFEYLATRKAMLAVVPEGETARIVRQFQQDAVQVPSDPAGIAAWLATRLAVGRSNQCMEYDAKELEQYSRREQTRRLVDLLNRLVVSRY